MSNKQVPGATLPGYQGPFFFPCLEKMQEEFYGATHEQFCGQDLKDIVRSIPGYLEMNRPYTEDRYQWFWALEFKVGASRIAILLPLGWDAKKSDDTSADRHIALYQKGDPSDQAIQGIVGKMMELKRRFFKVRGCKNFIVAAIRQTRLTPKGLNPGTCAGKALHSIYALAKEHYSESVFRESLAELIDRRILLLAGRISEMPHGTSGWVVGSIRKLSQVPADVPLEKAEWYFDEKGKSMEIPWEKQYILYIRHILLYVIEDGLPVTIEMAVSRKVPVSAGQILASLQK